MVVSSSVQSVSRIVVFLCVIVVTVSVIQDDLEARQVLRFLASTFRTPQPEQQDSTRRPTRQAVSPLLQRVMGAGAIRTPRKGPASAGITWKSCGSRKDPMQLQKFVVKPNPVKIPGPLKAELAVLVKEPLSAPIRVQLQLQKEVPLPLGLGSTWLELPCPGNSCAVPDVCATALLPREFPVCPAPVDESKAASNNTIPFAWRECACPIPKGVYAMPPLEFNLTAPARNILPDYLQGGFYIKMRLTRNKRRLACLETTLDLDF